MGSVLEKFVYPSSSILITALSVVNLVSMANAGISEARGINMQYSKFCNTKNAAKSETKQVKKLSATTGMLLAYSPSFLVASTALVVYQHEGFRFLLVASALAAHFFKRILEVIYVHKYSSFMVVETSVTISLSYTITTTALLYAQYLAQGYPNPQLDLKNPGITLFLIGIAGNLYHHCLLSMLRRDKNEKEYKVPKGGLFGLVICPHYLFEIFTFLGLSLISQTLYGFCVATGVTLYFMGRSFATKRWYLSNIEDFPKSIRLLVPYLF